MPKLKKKDGESLFQGSLKISLVKNNMQVKLYKAKD